MSDLHMAGGLRFADAGANHFPSFRAWPRGAVKAGNDVLEFKTCLLVQTPELGGCALAPACIHKHVDIHPLARIELGCLGHHPLHQHHPRQMRRFTRLTNPFSRSGKNLWAAYCLHFAYYNFCRVHRTLRVTPAREAGIADNVWDLSELLA